MPLQMQAGENRSAQVYRHREHREFKYHRTVMTTTTTTSRPTSPAGPTPAELAAAKAEVAKLRVQLATSESDLAANQKRAAAAAELTETQRLKTVERAEYSIVRRYEKRGREQQQQSQLAIDAAMTAAKVSEADVTKLQMQLATAESDLAANHERAEQRGREQQQQSQLAIDAAMAAAKVSEADVAKLRMQLATAEKQRLETAERAEQRGQKLQLTIDAAMTAAKVSEAERDDARQQLTRAVANIDAEQQQHASEKLSWETTVTTHTAAVAGLEQQWSAKHTAVVAGFEQRAAELQQGFDRLEVAKEALRHKLNAATLKLKTERRARADEGRKLSEAVRAAEAANAAASVETAELSRALAEKSRKHASLKATARKLQAHVSDVEAQLAAQQLETRNLKDLTAVLKANARQQSIQHEAAAEQATVTITETRALHTVLTGELKRQHGVVAEENQELLGKIAELEAVVESAHATTANFYRKRAAVTTQQRTAQLQLQSGRLSANGDEER